MSDQPSISTHVSIWRIAGWVCAGIVVASVLACVAMAIARSQGLVAVVVTAVGPNPEPVDLVLPLVNQDAALPDYELAVVLTDGAVRYLGTKPDESAANGLEWKLSEPVSLAQLASVRLREKDKMLSDDLVEVQVTDPSVEANGYRFNFKTQRSFGVGVRAFFNTPVGIAITGAFFVAVLVFILSNLAV